MLLFVPLLCRLASARAPNLAAAALLLLLLLLLLRFAVLIMR